MKSRADKPDDRGLLRAYDFTNGVRGKYAERYAKGTNIIHLAPDVADIFPDSDAVNEALRALANVARRAAKVDRS